MPTRSFIQKRNLLPFVAAASLLLFLASFCCADEPTSKEYQVKAAYLFNFTKFVEWPAGVFASDNAPLVIGILGDDPFGPLLDGIVKGETQRNRKLIIKRAKQIDGLKSCQVLFISKSEQSKLPQILAELNDAGVLTVGESENFAARGGIVNFYLDDGKVRFEINQEAAKRRGIKISSRLLSLARIVQ